MNCLEANRLTANHCRASGGKPCSVTDSTRAIVAATVNILNTPSTFLCNIRSRGGDALHLTTAAENGFAGIYTDDRHLQAAASLFRLKAVSVIR
jgi:hypothetical protein